MPSAGESPDLRRLSGLLVLVGAGNMGSALLDGWLRLGLDPAKTVVIEPSLRRRSPPLPNAACGSIRVRQR